MKHIINIFNFSIFIFLISSCGTNHKNKSIKYVNDIFNQEYKHSKHEFPDSLTKHFPRFLNNNNNFYSSDIKNKPKEFLYLIVSNKLTIKDKSTYKNIQNSSDSCLIYIFRKKHIWI